MNTMVGLIAVILASASAYFAAGVLAPLTLALFIIAVVWPLQCWLQQRLPKLAGVALVMVLIVAVCLAFATLAVSAFGRVGRSLVADAARYQSIYDGWVSWLETQGIPVAGVWAEHFNVAWLFRAAQQVSGRVNTTLTFWLITVAYVMLGLMEVGEARRRIQSLDNREAARLLLEGISATAGKFRRYLWVRT